MATKYEFYKNNDSDVIYWVDNASDTIGEHLFSFDKKKVYNLFYDYPWKLSTKEREVFDSENHEWAEFFKDRK